MEEGSIVPALAVDWVLSFIFVCWKQEWDLNWVFVRFRLVSYGKKFYVNDYQPWWKASIESIVFYMAIIGDGWVQDDFNHQAEKVSVGRSLSHIICSDNGTALNWDMEFSSVHCAYHGDSRSI